MEAIERFERQEWSPVEIRKRAEEFSVPVFRQRLSRFLERVNAPVSSADLNPVHERFPVAYGMDTALGRRAATSL